MDKAHVIAENFRLFTLCVFEEDGKSFAKFFLF
jgi:hypothetical protein